MHWAISRVFSPPHTITPNSRGPCFPPPTSRKVNNCHPILALPSAELLKFLVSKMIKDTGTKNHN